jgi:capsular polysaccharide biosynthesis protein
MADDELENVWLRALELTDAAVFPDLQWSPWLPRSGKILQGYATRRGLTARQQPKSILLMQNNRQLLARLPIAKPNRIEGPTILIGSADNRHHFLVEHLSRVATLEALGVSTAGARWIVGKHLQPYQREYLALTGVAAEQLLPLDAHDNLVFAHLIAPTPLGRGAKQLSALMPRWTREVLVARAGAALAPQPMRRIYLSSGTNSSGQLSNELEVAAWLRTQGFEHFIEEALDAAALIRLFAQSRELVTTLGPTLTHMLFMPKGARITALYNSHRSLGSEGLEFDYVARACGHKLQAVAGAPAEQPEGQDQHVNFEVKIGDLVAAFGSQ